MKILYFITQGNSVGGAGIHVRDLALACIRRGDEVTVAVGTRGRYYEMLVSCGIRVISVETLSRNTNLLSDIASLYRFIQIVKKYQPEVVSLHSTKAGFIGRLVCASLNVKCIFTAHGWAFADGTPFFQRIVSMWAEKLTSRLAIKTICVSRADYELGIAIGLRQNRLVHIHNGMPDTIQPVHFGRLESQTGSFVRVVMVARFDKQKNQEQLIRVCLKLPLVQLIFVGDGPTQRRCNVLVEQLQMQNRVQFLGYRSDIDAVLANADIFALISNWEGFPRSTIEALRAGLPVLVSDVGGACEAIVEGENGYKIKCADEAMLLTRLESLVQNADLRRRFGQKSRLLYEGSFTFDHMFRKTSAVYNDFKSSSPPPSKKRIVILTTNADLAGAPIHVRDVSLALHKDGIELTVIFGQSGTIVDQLVAAGIRTIVLPNMRSNFNIWQDIRTLRILTKLIKELQPHIVHLHSSKAGMLGRAACVITRTACVYTIHGWGFGPGRKKIISFCVFLVERFFVKFTPHFIAVCSDDREIGLEKLSIRSDKITVIHNGICKSASNLAKPSHSNIIVMVARDDYQKDYATLLKACNDLQIELWCVGRGTDTEDFRKKAELLAPKILTKIRFFGVQQNIPNLLSKAAVFVLASRHEGLPISIIEAMQAGLPVIATDVGGVSELVTDEVGFTFESENANQLRERLIYVMSKPQLRDQLGLSAHQRYLEFFSAEVMMKKIYEVYRKL
jgi:glycosyltransferase involved in cell wall biosynthesis